jgi:hypothetical protein
MLFRLAIVVSIVLANSGFSSLDKKVLYDFRNEPATPAAPDKAIRLEVISAAIGRYSVTPSTGRIPGCRPGTAAQIRGSSNGSFTAAGLKQAAYLVDLDECMLEPSATTRRVLVFTAGRLTANVEVPGVNAVLGTYDLDGDGKSELLLGRSQASPGQRTRSATVVEFDKDKVSTVESFGQIYDDTCAANLPSKSISASVVYYFPPPAGQKPRFAVELYRAPCPAKDQQPQWTRAAR